MNLKQIKAALAAGLPVHWSNVGYVVKGDTITFTPNDHSIGLTWADGVTLNGEESDFFVGECVELRNFIDGYIECALWSTGGEFEGEYIENFDDFDLNPNARPILEKHCRDFVSDNVIDLLEYAKRYEHLSARPWECAGHDFWLTRHRHGAGFWDRGLGALGERLTEVAHACGEVHLFIDDSGEVSL